MSSPSSVQGEGATLELGGQRPVERDGGGESARADRHPEPAFFDGLAGEGNSFGPHAIDLVAGGIRARLTGLSARQQAELAARYGIFAHRVAGNEEVEEEVQVDLHLKVRCTTEPGFLRLSSEGPAETYRLLTRKVDDGLMAWSYEWASLWNRSSRTAVLAATTGDREIFDRIIENFLRVVFAHEMMERGGLLLHGAGVVRDGRAYLFFGPSGSGKTTVTTLSPDDHILSDDLVMIVPHQQGSEAGFAACSVPFRGLLTPPAMSDRVYPLAGLYRLVQSVEDRVEPLDPPRAVGELVQSLPFITDCPEAAPRMLEVASAVAGSTSVNRLHFRKDKTFWRVVENVGRTAA